jgi:two-component system cell cycle response regulator
MKILVVEDHPAQLKLAHHVLSAAGHTVSDAEAAGEAFAVIKSDRPQLILVDLLLPGLDGLTLIRMLKADPETSGIHVVAVTSYPEEYPKAAAMAAGCDGYIVKPLDTRELSSQLTAVAQRREAAKLSDNGTAQ